MPLTEEKAKMALDGLGEIYKCLREVYFQLPKEVQEAGFKNNEYAILMDFDISLQIAFIKISMSDGEISRDQAAFLDKLFDGTDDLMSIYDSLLGEPSIPLNDNHRYTSLWDKKGYDHNQLFRGLAGSVKLRTEKDVGMALKAIGIAKALTGKDYPDTLFGCVSQMEIIFEHIDGEVSQEQINYACTVLNESIFFPINRYEEIAIKTISAVK